MDMLAASNSVNVTRVIRSSGLTLFKEPSGCFESAVVSHCAPMLTLFGTSPTRLHPAATGASLLASIASPRLLVEKQAQKLSDRG